MGVAVCEIAVWASCGVGELWCVAVMVRGVLLWGSRSVCGSRCLPNLNSFHFWRYLIFLRFFRLRKKLII